MKTKLAKSVLFGVVFATILTFIVYPFLKKDKKEQVLELPKNTEVVLVNGTSDSVEVYLTLGSVGDTNYVQSTEGIFGITQSATQSSFWLTPNDTLYYLSTKGFNGNLSFGAAPQNCPDTTLYPSGINLFEFALNNNFNLNGQETVDISGVSGTNSLLEVYLYGGLSSWNNGSDTISYFYNKGQYENTGLSGVYPFGCDSCVGITPRTPYCAGHRPYAKPQSKNICNIQRPSGKCGGSVIVVFKGLVKAK